MNLASTHFGPAVAATPFQIGSLSEDEARAAFMQFRFARHGGQPFCERCDCTAVHSYKCRPIFKCKLCEGQFSITSGTPWAHKKLRYKKLLYLISCFSHAAQAVTARQLCRDIGIQYKTALLWVHKIRAELARDAAGHKLSGEVELDGAVFGGTIRPKNVAKERRDLRRIPYRAKDRELWVVNARERGGATRTWIVRSEGDARTAIKAVLEDGTTLYTDQAAHWSWFRGWFRLFQVNHSREYYTPEACTNFSESFNAFLRAAERMHRHIAQNYFDLYAAEAAWRIQRNKWGDKDGLAFVMRVMSRKGRSELAGYFQGKKRACNITQADGTTKAWRPPTPEERHRDRATRLGADAAPPRRSVLSRDWQRGFTFVSAKEFAANPQLVPETAGVYALMVAGGQMIVRSAGYNPDHSPALWCHEGSDHLYTGETYALRTRLREHLLGDCDASTLRETMLAMQWSGEHLPEGPEIDRDALGTEQRLTDWLSMRVVIGFKPCGYVREMEAQILRSTGSPLNLSGKAGSPFSASLRDMRRRFREDVSSQWQARGREKVWPKRH